MCVSTKSASDSAATLASFFASAKVAVSGLSQITWMPRFKNSRATGACMWLGVTIDTASMPFFRRASRLAIVAKSS